jgi:hypothetical protein
MRTERIWPNGLRYLWTDAFGLVLYVSLYYELREERWLDEAERCQQNARSDGRRPIRCLGIRDLLLRHDLKSFDGDPSDTGPENRS